MMELRFITKDFRFGNVRVWFDAKQHCLELICSFWVFLRYSSVVHEFGVSLKLRMMVCMVSMVKQSIWKSF